MGYPKQALWLNWFYVPQSDHYRCHDTPKLPGLTSLPTLPPVPLWEAQTWLMTLNSGRTDNSAFAASLASASPGLPQLHMHEHLLPKNQNRYVLQPRAKLASKSKQAVQRQGFWAAFTMTWGKPWSLLTLMKATEDPKLGRLCSWWSAYWRAWGAEFRSSHWTSHL